MNFTKDSYVSKISLSLSRFFGPSFFANVQFSGYAHSLRAHTIHTYYDTTYTSSYELAQNFFLEAIQIKKIAQGGVNSIFRLHRYFAQNKQIIYNWNMQQITCFKRFWAFKAYFIDVSRRFCDLCLREPGPLIKSLF